MKIKKNLVVVMLLLVCLGVRGQSPKQVLQWMNTVKAEAHGFDEVIPFDYRNGCIVIKVEIGGRVYDYIFDTGGYNDITDGIQAVNHFPVLTTQTVGSSNGLKTKVNMVKVDSLKIGKLVFKDVAALQMDFKASPTIACTIDGALIGASIIKKYIWQIDYPNRKIMVTDRLREQPEGIRLPVTFNSRLMPYINLKLDGQEQKLLFDLGSSSLLMLKQYSGSKEAIMVNGVASEGGNGVVQRSMQIFKADVSGIGKDVPVYVLPGLSEDLIGNPIIKNYIVTLNFPANELYLTPIPGSTFKPGLETFGFSLKYAAGKIMVANLYQGLAPGLNAGDEVVALNGKALAFPEACSANTALAALLANQTELTLTISKAGQTTELHFKKMKVF